MSLRTMIAAILTCASLSAGLATPVSAAMPVATVENPGAYTPQQVDVRVGFYVSGGRRYYNGQRGYRYQRPGYRYYNGFWFPGPAFIIGTVRPYGYERAIPGRLSRQHVGWCFDRYRSYRPYDNSYQPYNGPRRVCRSPYW